MPVKTNISTKLFFILREASFIQQDSEDSGLFCFIFGFWAQEIFWWDP